MSTISRLIRRAIWSKTLFEFTQRLGFHFTRNHFYSPIPDTRQLARNNKLWNTPSDMPGVNLNDDAQLNHLEQIFPAYKHELDFTVDKTPTPHEYYLNNAEYGIVDASVLHCMIRHYHPRTVIEIGSGNSTYAAARAAIINHKENHPTELVSIEPYPRATLTQGFSGLTRHIKNKVEDVPMDLFEQLQKNDILFIDSSHVVRTGNDVIYEYLEILPRLKPGVIVHIHDIFFPFDYPRKWVVENRAFWSEQYLLQALLCHNNKFEVLFGNFYMQNQNPEKMKAFFAPPQGYLDRTLSTSFWMRKTSGNA
jgi:Methyltransferase domain